MFIIKNVFAFALQRTALLTPPDCEFVAGREGLADEAKESW